MNNPRKVVADELATLSLYACHLPNPHKLNNKKVIEQLLHIVSEVTDFRDQMKIHYKLDHLLCICVLIALRGKFTSFLYVEDYIELNQKEFIRLGLIEKGKIPSHDTLRRLFMCLDVNELRDCLLYRIRDFLKKLCEADESSRNKTTLLSVDGKTFNGSGRKGKQANINVLNIYNASSGICLSSTPLVNKESEIPEAQRLLLKFNLEHTLVTADALHCQKNTCQIIIRKKGNYLFKVKENQLSLLNEIKARFGKIKKHKIVKYNQCEYEFYHLEDGYIGDEWPEAKVYARMVSHKRIHQADYNPEDQYFITSCSDENLIMEGIDNRWCIEGDFHQFKDLYTEEDACTFTDKNAVKCMAVINNIVYAIFRITAAINNEPMRKTRIRYEDHPIEMIRVVLPILDKKNATQLINQNMRGTHKNK